MLCDHSSKKLSFHNFSSSSLMYIMLNKYVKKKKDFYFDGLPCIPLHFCVYDTLLLKLNGEKLMK